MTHGSHAYASARLAELHRAGADRRRASTSARDERLALVMALMRRYERSSSDRARRLAVAASPVVTQR